MKNPLIVLMGGFGNQLFQLAFALERYPDKPFRLETNLGRPRVAINNQLDLQSYSLPSRVSVTSEHAGRLTRKLINLVLRMSISERNMKLKFRVVASLGLLLKIVRKENSRVVCGSGVGLSELNHRTSKANDLVIGYFQSSRFFSEKTLALLKEMKYTQTIDGYEVYKEMALSLKPIIVHVRLGDYELEDGIGLLPNSYYLNALSIALNEYPNSPIWIFSNDMPKTIERFKDFDFSNLVFVEDNWNSTSATFEIMRLGSSYVIANSSFSYWAALLSKAPKPLVIAPKPWFQGSLSPNEILPDNWKTVPTK